MILLVYTSNALTSSKVHEQFVQHFPGGKDVFFEAIRERSDWSPLQIFEYKKLEAECRFSDNADSYNSMGPVIQCPPAIFESFGMGDGEKRICGSMKDRGDCVVISIGSHNEWEFEAAVIEKYPNCRVHTFDCFFSNASVPAGIQNAVTFYPICLGISDKTLPTGEQFLSWPSMVKKLGLIAPPTVMKMDIEGFEWTTIPAIIKSNIHVPESFSFELHYVTSTESVPWFGRRRSEPEIGMFMELLFHLGYVLVDRHDNPSCLTCTEIIIAKLVPNSRFNHHGAGHAISSMQSNLALGTVYNASVLKVDPFPTAIVAPKL